MLRKFRFEDATIDGLPCYSPSYRKEHFLKIVQYLRASPWYRYGVNTQNKYYNYTREEWKRIWREENEWQMKKR